MPKMKKLFDSKIFVAVVSLIISLTLWVYVTSVENDDYKLTLRGVPVELIGTGILEDSKGMVVTDLSTNTVNVELVGPRRVVAKLSSDNIKAQIDVSKLTQSAYASMQYSINYPNGTDTSSITITRKVPDTINFTVSKLNSKSIPVRGSFGGSIAPGYTARPIVFEPSEITVSGPESYLRNISYAWVSFGSAEISGTYSVETGFTLMTEGGEQAAADGVSCSADVITATQPILEMKTLPLTVNLIYGAGANENNVKVTVSPESITLAGDSAVLDAMNNIPIATVDLMSFNSTFSQSYPVNFDNSLTNISGVTEADVTVEIIGLETKNFTVKNLQCRGVTEGLVCVPVSQALVVKLRGTAEELARVAADDIVAVSDLTDYELTTGSLIVPARIQVDGSTDVGAIGDYNISVEIRKAEVEK